MRIRRASGSAFVLLLMASAAICATEDAAPEDMHVPPQAAAQPMQEMPRAQMDTLMDMHDDPLLVSFKLDQLERDVGNGARTSWDLDSWLGKDYDKLWLRSEGERRDDARQARVEVFWDHAYAAFWNWQLGIRHDVDDARGRRTVQHDWAAFGVRGLAPYGIELETTAYLSDGGRAALRLRAEYELMFTQRLVLQPEIEANLYSRADAQSSVRAGLSDAQVALRLRYELRRDVAPYIGISWSHRSSTSDFAHPDVFRGGPQWIAGLRIWF